MAVCWLFLLELRALQRVLSHSSALFVSLFVCPKVVPYVFLGRYIRDTLQFRKIPLNSSSLPTGVSCNLFAEWDPAFLAVFSWTVGKRVDIELEGSLCLRVESPREDQKAGRTCRAGAWD